MRPSVIRTHLILLALGPLLCVTGCDSGVSPTQASASSAAAEWQVIVEPEWLQERLLDRSVIVIDTREPDEYGAGHIPGAVNVPRSATYDQRPGRTSDAAPVPQIERLFGSNGVSQATPVVVYDEADYRDAARVFWVLEVHGHPRVAVLNGGLSGWHERGYAVTTEPAVPRPCAFIANLQPDRMSSKLQVMQSIGDQGTLILDARSEDEYLGLKTVTERAGHIPSAFNVEARSNLEQTPESVCRLHDVQQLSGLYADMPGDARIITYCNSGTRASVSYLVLRALGRNVAVYDGSWREWSADPTLPVETGAGPLRQREGAG